MRREYTFDSCGAGKIHCIRWSPEGTPRAAVQIVHGIADYAARYEEFALYLNSLGYLVVAEDHMGHGGTIGGGSIQGYFHGGWFAAVEDTCRLMRDTMAEFPDTPYILFGHSMGSFMARTILAKYPDCGIRAAVISGTGWMNPGLVAGVKPLIGLVCAVGGERKPSKFLHSLMFGSYNQRIEHPRTPNDWLSRDSISVDAYNAHPHTGFVPCAGLVRDMFTGISYIQQPQSLASMKKDLPVFFVAGGDDPVGSYGESVRETARKFEEAGMEQVQVRIYPLCRHEILNEINRREIFADISRWMEDQLG